MKFLFLFLDGVGLGAADISSNPFARANMPRLEALLGPNKLLAKNAPHENDHASLIALDATLTTSGLPQSATGQASLLTGRNIPELAKGHYGPKPNQVIRDLLDEGNLFKAFTTAGLRGGLLNAYPQGYFEGIDSGRRLYSAIPHAVTSAGLPLFDADDLLANKAISADFTGHGWRERLGYPDTPVRSPYQAGQFLAALSKQFDFAFFEYWLSDYVGHSQNMADAVQLLETLDEVIGGLTFGWHGTNGLILITSDHGNLEDLSTRRHTKNQVPAIIIGEKTLRRTFSIGLKDISQVAPAILRLFKINQ